MNGMHSKGRYNPFAAYGQFTTTHMLLSLGLNALISEKYGIRSYELYFGRIITDLWRHSTDDFVRKSVEGQDAVRAFKKLEQGSSTMPVAGLDPTLRMPHANGDNVYLDDCQLTEAVAWDWKREYSEKLLELVRDWTGRDFLWHILCTSFL